MRKFKSYRAALDVARMNGWVISHKETSECGSFVLVLFKVAAPQSQLMAGLI